MFPPVCMAPAVKPSVMIIGDQITCAVFALLNTPLAPPTALTATEPDAMALSSVLINVTGGAYEPLFEVPGSQRNGVAA